MAGAAPLSCAHTDELTVDIAVVGIPYNMNFGSACLTEGDRLSNVMVSWGDGTTGPAVVSYQDGATITYEDAQGLPVTGPATLALLSATHVFARATTTGPLAPPRGAGVDFSVSGVDEPSGLPAAPYCGCELQVVSQDVLRPVPVRARRSKRFSGPVARLDRPLSPDPGLTATIDWGDGTRSAGTVVQGARYDVVTGTHTWWRLGRPRVSVSITDQLGPQHVATTDRVRVTR